MRALFLLTYPHHWGNTSLQLIHHFYDIWKNKFKVINILKLSTDFESLTEDKKFWNVVDREIQSVNDNRVPDDIKSINHLMKYLIVYFQIILQFTLMSN